LHLGWGVEFLTRHPLDNPLSKIEANLYESTAL
jgi:hypothetical protein